MPGWLEALTVGQVIGWLVALGVLAGGLRWLRPIADGLRYFVDAWQGESRPGMPARLGLMEQVEALGGRLEMLQEGLERVQQDAASAAFNTQSNHGSSSHDAVMREIREMRRVQAKQEGTLLAISRKQDAQAEQQQAFEVAIRESIADRAEIREHIGLPPPEPESEEQ